MKHSKKSLQARKKGKIQEFDIKRFSDISLFFDFYNLKNIFPQIFSLFKIYLTIPVSSAEAERSFSCLKRIKTWLRSTMSQDRLSGLAVLQIEREETEKLDLDKIVEIFALRKNRNLKFF